MAKNNKNKYYQGLGRRRTATAMVRLYKNKKSSFKINDKPLEEYFQRSPLRKKAREPLLKVEALNDFKVQVLVRGGGLNGQAEAIRLGVARALLEYDPDLRQDLKEEGYLMRDPRMKERQKPGLKGARRAPQWQKR
ncbi:MAG: 30S ribosomal protein S9 [Minisyncoccales bacterium]